MQLFEIALCLLIALLLVRLLVGKRFRLPKISYLLVIGLLLLMAGWAVEGYRWQMIPAYLSFALIALASRKRSKTHPALKVLGTTAVGVLLTASVVLGLQLPIVSLPAPDGPYSVGTFDYVAEDSSRNERYAPTQKRQIYVRAWYPASKNHPNTYPVRTLWQELYNGEFDLISFFSGHLSHIKTHSQIEAPIARGEKFPVLLFNHGYFLIAEQNTVLMEHLASNGYVVFSIGRPYEGAKINFGHSASITASGQLPDDVVMSKAQGEAAETLFYKVLAQDELAPPLTAINNLLTSFSAADDEATKRVVVINGLEQPGIRQLDTDLTQEALFGLLTYLWHKNQSVDQWLKDIQFVADNISGLDTPIDNFQDSLNAADLGVFGMSFGGAAAGEFCKTDSRCLAGGNMDGLQYGKHWNDAVDAPFLMMYSTENSGMNDFAYPRSENPLLDYTLKNSMHADFTDLSLIFPLIHNLEMETEINAQRIYDIINSLHLRFFDRYLKGAKNQVNLAAEIPEISIR